MDIISTLESQKYSYEAKISNANNQIKKCERAYDSLSKFKTAAENSQNDFNTVNANKSGILSELEDVKMNSITAQRYYAGMKNIFLGIGTKVIAVVYTVLLASISTKLRSYVNSINNYEDDIETYQKRIKEIESKIEDIKKAEALAKQIMGGIV